MWQAYPAARVLVVDDDPILCLALGRALSRKGYAVQSVHSGAEALALLEREPQDVMVLDLIMPGLSGLEVMQRAREMLPDMLIVILTGQASLESAIAAVRQGAADYLHKPIRIQQAADAISVVLEARAERLRQQVVLRAMSEMMTGLQPSSAPPNGEAGPEPASSSQMTASTLYLDQERQRVVVGGDPPRTCQLTPGEASLLTELMAHPGEVLSSRQLARAVLGYPVEERQARNVVRHHILRLRQKIEAIPTEPRLIVTVRGDGYVFNPDQ
jgi:two-component system KDP operon response regulator KdpE